MTNDIISTLFRADEEALLALQASVTAYVNNTRASMRAKDEELEAKDQQIQELKEEMEKMRANYRRREEIIKSLVRAECDHELTIGHKKRICDNYYELCYGLKSILSGEGLIEDLRPDLEEEMDEAKDRFHEVQAEILEEERKFDELVKPLKDELEALK